MKLNHHLHLAYSTNIHRGENWDETFAGLEQYTLKVRDQVCPTEPYAIGLRLGDLASRELSEPATLSRFQKWLEQHNCYVFTVNGFPYGRFHGGRVKEQVYVPDWTTCERLEYTKRLFDLLAQLVPPGVWLTILLAGGVAVLLQFTRFGRHVVAIGSSEPTARLCGVAVEQTRILVYAIASALAAVAGVLQYAYLTVGDPTTALGMELDIIAAVVIGGASLAGGRGSVAGTLIGALIMTVVANGCTKLELPNWVQEIVTGVIIVAAVTLDRLRRGEE